MRKKFENGLRAAVKDCGLSTTAIDALVEQGQAAIGEETSEEQVTTLVNSYIAIAKTIQGEVTRKLQAAKEKDKDPDPAKEKTKDGDGDAPKQDRQGLPEDFLKSYNDLSQKVTELLAEKEKETKDKETKDRATIVTEAARKAGLPESFAALIASHHTDVKTKEEAEKVVAEYRQEWVNNNLRAKRAAGGAGSSTASEADKNLAKSFVDSLPDKPAR